MGSSRLFSGCRRIRPFSLKNRLTVASSSNNATMMSPLSASGWRRTTTMSSSSIPASIMLSPRTVRMKNSPSPVKSAGRGKISSRFSTANSGTPAATRPRTGMPITL